MIKKLNIFYKLCRVFLCVLLWKRPRLYEWMQFYEIKHWGKNSSDAISHSKCQTFECMCCLGCPLQTKLITRRDVPGSRWLTTSAKQFTVLGENLLCMLTLLPTTFQSIPDAILSAIVFSSSYYGIKYIREETSDLTGDPSPFCQVVSSPYFDVLRLKSRLFLSFFCHRLWEASLSNICVSAAKQHFNSRATCCGGRKSKPFFWIFDCCSDKTSDFKTALWAH